MLDLENLLKRFSLEKNDNGFRIYNLIILILLVVIFIMTFEQTFEWTFELTFEWTFELTFEQAFELTFELTFEQAFEYLKFNILKINDYHLIKCLIQKDYFIDFHLRKIQSDSEHIIS